ncbi:potassium channel family protein [Phytomonospora sp. NPDC050363]|uniref:potassium channel family protein n=1 Tax=Phytomonospora sp. NPDC050363 TaxID=3155642 RepID=UPI0033CEB38E
MAPPAHTEPALERWEQRTRWILTTLAVAFLVAYAVPVLWPGIHPSVKTTAVVVDIVVWAVFAADYIARLIIARDKRGFIRANLIDLVIVLLPPARPLRLLRVIVVLVEALTRQAHMRARARLGVFVGGTVVLMVIVSALAVLDAERASPDGKILNYPDALWWAVVTVTTVGYGDFFPVTVEGKFVAVTLMLTGIGLIAFVTGSLASWVVEKVAAEGEESEEETREDIAAVLVEVRALRTEIADLREEREAREKASEASAESPEGARTPGQEASDRSPPGPRRPE